MGIWDFVGTHRTQLTKKQRKEIVDKQGGICARKGCNTHVTTHSQLHHKNKDKSDNRPRNREFLCIKCHKKIHEKDAKKRKAGLF